MVTLLGPVPCGSCHASVYLKRRKRGLIWLEHHNHDYWMGGTWRTHICTAKEPDRRERWALDQRRRYWERRYEPAQTRRGDAL